MKVLNQAFGKNWAAYHGDSCEVIKAFPDNSIHHHIFSPPFNSLFTFSNSVRDLSNSPDMDFFIDHFEFLAKELLRTLMPGRIMAVHCCNLPRTYTTHGYQGIFDFRGELIRLFERIGFVFHSEVTIWKDPVVAMQRSKAQGLLHKTVKEDSTISRQGIPDYLIVFRKPGENTEPVCGYFETFSGEGYALDEIRKLQYKAYNDELRAYQAFTRLTNEQQKEFISIEGYEPTKPAPLSRNQEQDSIEVWQRYASPVWMDISQGDVLVGKKGSKTKGTSDGKDNEDRKHMTPLQLTVVRRALQLWTNPGDIVYSPFGGIGTEGYVAIEQGRKAILSELKEAYFKVLVHNMKVIAGDEVEQLNLLDSLYSRELQTA